MDMQNATLITLCWELYEQGIPKARIAARLGKHRETIHVWIKAIQHYGLLGFLDRYEQAKKAREAKKKQTVIELKEIKLRPKTEEHDFQFKARHAERFLKEGNKAKITMMFRGREMVRMDRGKVLLEKFVEALKDTCVVEQPPKVEGRNMSMILAPKH